MLRDDAGTHPAGGAEIPLSVELPKGYHKRVRGFIGGEETLITMDSGSFRNMVNEGFLNRLRAWAPMHEFVDEPIPCGEVSVGGAQNGMRASYDSLVVITVTFRDENGAEFTFKGVFAVMKKLAGDMIIGCPTMDWLSYGQRGDSSGGIVELRRAGMVLAAIVPAAPSAGKERDVAAMQTMEELPSSNCPGNHRNCYCLEFGYTCLGPQGPEDLARDQAESELRMEFEEARVNELVLNHIPAVEAWANDEGISVGQALTELSGGNASVAGNLDAAVATTLQQKEEAVRSSRISGRRKGKRKGKGRRKGEGRGDPTVMNSPLLPLQSNKIWMMHDGSHQYSRTADGKVDML